MRKFLGIDFGHKQGQAPRAYSDLNDRVRSLEKNRAADRVAMSGEGVRGRYSYAYMSPVFYDDAVIFKSIDADEYIKLESEKVIEMAEIIVRLREENQSGEEKK